MKINLSRIGVRVLPTLQILALLTLVNSAKEKHLNSKVRLAQCVGVSPTAVWFC